MSLLLFLQSFPQLTVQRHKNLNLLREYARGFESGGYRGLSAFITYMDKLIENGADLESSSGANGETENTVKVISIHKSKGLEYPVCFIACSSKSLIKPI